MGQEEALVDATRKEEVLKDVIEVFTNVKRKEGIAVFRERPGDDLEGRGKEDLGQILICDG